MVWRSRQLCFSLLLLGTVVLYEIGKSPDAVLNVAAMWDAEIALPLAGPTRILVGVNTNLDMIVSAVDFLKVLEVHDSTPLDHSSLNSVAEIGQIVAFSMLHCAGIERTFTRRSVFDSIVTAASTIHHVHHVGGNAALIAQKIKSTHPSIEVMLVGPMGNQLKTLLHKDIVVPNFMNNTSKDEVHMILEYSSGLKWGEVKSSCANRVIFSHDVSNSKMMALESIQDAVGQFKPNLVILSGAHLLGGEQENVWKRRLNDTATTLKTISVPVHWELATIGNLQFFQQLAKDLFPRINSLGLNEQELISVAKSVHAPFDFNVLTTVDWVLDLLHWLMQSYSCVSGRTSVLTRVHFHSLKFHVIAEVEGGPWANSRAAVMAGARTAGLQACNANVFDANEFKLLIPKQLYVSQIDTSLPQKVGAGCIEWTRNGIHYFFSPVLICKRPSKTVGLGDAISASGLVYSGYIFQQ